MKSFSVALVRQRYAVDGGAEQFVSRLLAAMSGNEVKLTLITRGWSGAAGFEVMQLDPFALTRRGRDRSFAQAVCNTLKQHRFDLVQSHERIGCCDIYRAGDGVHREWLHQRARVLGAWARWAMALSPYHRYVLRAEEALFRSPQLRAVICNSKMVRDEIRQHFGVAEDRLHVIYNGVDVDAYHPRLKQHRDEIRARHGIPVEAPLFLFVGSGFERKGVGALLAAFANVPVAHLLIVGRDKRAAKFRSQAQRLNISARVHFVGVQRDVKPYYGAADAFVLPTLYDPFPNVVLEAMASGLPVITSFKCGAAEVIRPGANGYVVDALDVVGLAAAMQELCSTERCATLGAAARKTVEGFDFASMTPRLLALYRACIESTPPSGRLGVSQ